MVLRSAVPTDPLVGGLVAALSVKQTLPPDPSVTKIAAGGWSPSGSLSFVSTAISTGTPACVVAVSSIATGWRLGRVAVRVATALLPLYRAVIVALPGDTVVARPSRLTVATLVFDDLYLALLVTICELPSEKLAVTVNCWVWPTSIVADVGLMEMLSRYAFGPTAVTGTAVQMSRAPNTSSVRFLARETVIESVM